MTAPVAASEAASAPAKRAVWSLSVRLLHWTLAVSMMAAFATHEGAGKLHEAAGYVALAAASVRVLMGFAGGGYWRFSQFVQGLPRTLQYARDVWQRKERRYIGHNPLGGWMVLALLADAVATGLTGWLYTTDRFWGEEWLEKLHGALGDALPVLLILHVAGAIFTSLRHKENLLASMLHGRKAAPGPDDVV